MTATKEKELYKGTLKTMCFFLFMETEKAFEEYEKALEIDLPENIINEKRIKYEAMEHLIIRMGLVEQYNKYSKHNNITNTKENKTMMNFTHKDNGKQFISIAIYDGTNIQTVKDNICRQFPLIAENIFNIDDDEIIVNIPDGGMNFSLNELRQAAEKMYLCKVIHFVVDMQAQRA